jgi:hypothetical protein
MKYALVSPQENDRLCQVEALPFGVAPPLKWIECFDDVTPQTHKYEGGQFVLLPPIAPVAPPVPQSVTPRQARLALLGSGLLDQVEAAIATGSRADKITWEFAAEVRRDYAMISNLGSALGLTDAQIDDLFRAADVL